MNEQWRPIETAPRDGIKLLLWDHGYTLGWYETGPELGVSGQAFNDWTTGMDTNGGYDCGFRTIRPTAWMPLPEPPQENDMNENEAALDDMLNGVSDGESNPTFEDYAELVRQWASDRQIIQNSTAAAQLEKLDEERQETIEAIYQYMFREELSNDPSKAWEEVVDGFGDQLVCLINAAAIAGVDLTDALAHAYETIKDRRGYLASNGIFVKDEASHE